MNVGASAGSGWTVHMAGEGTVYDVSEAETLPRGARRVRAAGHPHAVFPIAPAELAKAAGARVLPLAE